MKKVKSLLWSTAHTISPEQAADSAGIKIVPLSDDLKAKLVNCPADYQELALLADQLIEEIKAAGRAVVMPIGSPAFNAIFWRRYKHIKFDAYYSHSERVSVDLPDGTKVSKFKHIKWVRV